MIISVICVYNNRDSLESHLLKSLDGQSIEYELILLKNIFDKYNSAAEALNYGGSIAKGQYLMFIHQDFEFNSDKWLEDVENILKNLDFGVAGVAGKYGRKCVSNITDGFPPALTGEIQIKEPEEVQTIDECVIIIPEKLFKEIHFDEITCDNWHLYGVDYCLTAKKAGFKVYVLPIDGYHASIAENSKSHGNYYSTLRKVIKKHKNEHKWIYTTTGSWSTIFPLNLQILYQKIYYSIHPKK